MFYSVWVLISTINYSYTKAYDAVGLNLSFKLPEKKPFFDGLDLDGGNWQPGHLLKSDDSDWECTLIFKFTLILTTEVLISS